MKKDSLTRYEYIDALRGYAILGVIFYHMRVYFPIKGVVETIAGWGNYGVQLFYIVSSYSLLMSLTQRVEKDGRNLYSFYFIRRFFRIAPLFYFCIAVYMIIQGSEPRGTAVNGVGIGSVITSMLFINGWFPEYINSVINVEWSIAVESNFYILLPLLFLIIKNLKTALVGMFIMLIVAVGANATLKFFGHDSIFHYFWLPSQLPVFGAGITLYFIIQKLNLNAPEDKRISKFGSALIILSGIFVFVFLMLFKYAYWKHFFISFGYILAIIGIAANPFRVLINPFTVHVGKISFSAYLLHMLVLEFVQWLFGNRLPSPYGYYTAVPLVLGLCIGVSTLTYKYIELPGQDMGKRIIERIKAKKAVSDPVTTTP